ncbi:MAG TPA: hypothetical protein VN660_03265 [Steroidobacteraceae bacterium]|nr:hypothetical protein [Steroidobacteraceae bacterium]
MDPNVSHLLARESIWDQRSVWLAGAVAVGVACEAVTEFDQLAERMHLNTLDRQHGLRKAIAKFGLLVLIIALSLEVAAAIKTHNISQNITADLTQQIADGQKREATLINTTNALRRQGVIQTGILNALTGRADQFQAAADAQRMRIDRAMTTINKSEKELNTAQAVAKASAAKAAAASALADSTAAQMKKTLDAEQQFDKENREQLTHRVLTANQMLSLSSELQPFLGTPYDVSAANDPDSVNLAWQVAQMLSEAGWTWKASTTTFIFNNGTLPAVGQYVGEGLHVTACKSDVMAFDMVAGALKEGLGRIGLSMSGDAVDDKLAPARQITCKILHVQIGAR